jgi:hypothetical protein
MGYELDCHVTFPYHEHKVQASGGQKTFSLMATSLCFSGMKLLHLITHLHVVYRLRMLGVLQPRFLYEFIVFSDTWITLSVKEFTKPSSQSDFSSNIQCQKKKRK